MIGAVRGWLLTVISVCLLCAVAGALAPRGPVKGVVRLACGLTLLAAVLSPLVQLDVESGRRWLEDYLSAVESREAELREEVNSQMKPIIEQEYAAYIVDKAAQLGLDCTARVECGEPEEGVYLPDRAEVRGILSEEEQARLSQIITQDLGIPGERIYIGEGEAR